MNRHQPGIQGDVRILKDRADRDGKLLSALRRTSKLQALQVLLNPALWVSSL